MAEFVYYFLGDKPCVVPLRNPPHRDTSARNAWAPTVDTRATLNQFVYIYDDRRCSDYIGLSAISCPVVFESRL